MNNKVVTETMNIIKNLINDDFNVEIKDEVELKNFIDNPEQYLTDIAIINKIKDLRDITIKLGGSYYE